MSLLQITRCVLIAAGLALPIHSANSTNHETIQQDSKYTFSDLHCLTKNIYHEARGESYKGKLAVAQVTMNRVNDPSRWASSICGVVYEKVRGIPQFTWTTMQNLKVVDYKSWLEAREIAYKVLTGELIINNFKHQYFHHVSLQIAQKYKNSLTIGNHVFY